MGNKVVGERIEFRRKQLGLTLDDIAREIGFAKSTVQRYERGTIETIKLPVIEAIANMMAVNPAWICGKTDVMEPEHPKETPAPNSESRPPYPPEYDLLSPEDRALVDNMIRSLAKKKSSD